MRVVVALLVFRAVIAWGAETIFLYRTSGTQGKYLLSTCYRESMRNETSRVIIADTFSSHNTGDVCHLIMSNAYVFQTEIGAAHMSTNGLSNAVQSVVFTKVLDLTFPKNTHLVSNNSVIELSNAPHGAPKSTNSVIYESDRALRELRKLGLKPPDE